MWCYVYMPNFVQQIFNGCFCFYSLCYQFHASCIDQWLRQQATCPICKYRLGMNWREESDSNTGAFMVWYFQTFWCIQCFIIHVVMHCSIIFLSFLALNALSFFIHVCIHNSSYISSYTTRHYHGNNCVWSELITKKSYMMSWQLC